MDKITKQTWIIGGLVLAGLMIIGFALDNLFSKNDVFFLTGLGLGLVFLAWWIYRSRNNA